MAFPVCSCLCSTQNVVLEFRFFKKDNCRYMSIINRILRWSSHPPISLLIFFYIWCKARFEFAKVYLAVISSLRLNWFYFASSVKDLMASWLDNDDTLDTISGFFLSDVVYRSSLFREPILNNRIQANDYNDRRPKIFLSTRSDRESNLSRT